MDRGDFIWGLGVFAHVFGSGWVGLGWVKGNGRGIDYGAVRRKRAESGKSHLFIRSLVKNTMRKGSSCT